MADADNIIYIQGHTQGDILKEGEKIRDGKLLRYKVIRGGWFDRENYWCFVSWEDGAITDYYPEEYDG